MPQLNSLQIQGFIIVLGLLLFGCVANRADDLYRQKQEQVQKRLSVSSTIDAKKTVALNGPPVQSEKAFPNDDDIDQQSIQRGKMLFNGKAVCFGCHGQNGDIRNVSNPKVAKLDQSPADLRKPTDKSVRQLYLIIRYGIPGTGMVEVQELAKLSNEEVLNVISYLLDLQGKPLSIETISHQRFHRDTETDIAIADMCEKEAIGDSEMEEYCEDRYAKRYRDLIIGRPPHIPTARYTEIEIRCKQQATKDLDKLALCYRTEYSASR